MQMPNTKCSRRHCAISSCFKTFWIICDGFWVEQTYQVTRIYKASSVAVALHAKIGLSPMVEGNHHSVWIHIPYHIHITFIQWGVATIQVLLKLLRLQHIGKGCFEVVELQITFLRIDWGRSFCMLANFAQKLKSLFQSIYSIYIYILTYHVQTYSIFYLYS